MNFKDIKPGQTVYLVNDNPVLNEASALTDDDACTNARCAMPLAKHIKARTPGRVMRTNDMKLWSGDEDDGIAVVLFGDDEMICFPVWLSPSP